MNLFKAKLNAVLMSALVAGLLILVGQTTASAKPVEASITPATYLDTTNLSEVVPSMPSAGELRLSPSYYRDDAAMIGNVANAPVTSQLRFSPSYHQDDPMRIEAAAPTSAGVEQQWGPIYHRDDPGLVNGGWSLSE